MRPLAAAIALIVTLNLLVGRAIGAEEMFDYKALSKTLRKKSVSVEDKFTILRDFAFAVGPHVLADGVEGLEVHPVERLFNNDSFYDFFRDAVQTYRLLMPEKEFQSRLFADSRMFVIGRVYNHSGRRRFELKDTMIDKADLAGKSPEEVRRVFFVGPEDDPRAKQLAAKKAAREAHLAAYRKQGVNPVVDELRFAADDAMPFELVDAETIPDLLVGVVEDYEAVLKTGDLKGAQATYLFAEGNLRFVQRYAQEWYRFVLQDTEGTDKDWRAGQLATAKDILERLAVLEKAKTARSRNQSGATALTAADSKLVDQLIDKSVGWVKAGDEKSYLKRWAFEHDERFKNGENPEFLKQMQTMFDDKEDVKDGLASMKLIRDQKATRFAFKDEGLVRCFAWDPSRRQWLEMRIVWPANGKVLTDGKFMLSGNADRQLVKDLDLQPPK